MSSEVIAKPDAASTMERAPTDADLVRGPSPALSRSETITATKSMMSWEDDDDDFLEAVDNDLATAPAVMGKAQRMHPAKGSTAKETLACGAMDWGMMRRGVPRRQPIGPKQN
eukprot:PhM_4_TR14267/c1_g1_i1/m.59691